MCTTTCSAGRATCWPSSRRTRDRREGAGTGPATGPERRVQDPAPGQRPDERGRDLQAAPRRRRAHRARDRAREPGRSRARERAGGALRSGAPERPGQFGVPASRSRAGQLRKVDGQGKRAYLRRHEAGGGEPHHHVGLTVFIVVEGPEGAGKSTLVRSLAARLQAEGRPVVTVREPGGTPVAEAARKVVLKFPHDMTPAAELFLFLTARTDLVQRVIRPALEAGARGVPSCAGTRRRPCRRDTVEKGRAGRRLEGSARGDGPSNTRLVMTLRKIVIVTVVAGLALATGGWLLQHEAAPAGSVYQQARLFEDVLAHVADYYVDSVDERRLYELAIDGMLDQLHDPYSVFLKRDDFKALNEATTGNYGGLGIQIEVRDGWITVVAPLPDTPAERAGVQTGDQIVALDGRSTEGWKQDQAVKELRGEAGSAVELRVHRVGIEQPLTFKLTRAVIYVRSVQVSTMLDTKVGYVLLTPLSEESAPELSQAVDSLLKKGMKSLILDLRGNPGGLLDQGVAVSELFLNPGEEVVAQRGRAPNSTRTYRDAKPQPWPSLPLVVLVNGGTASAAEIITGSLH